MNYAINIRGSQIRFTLDILDETPSELYVRLKCDNPATLNSFMQQPSWNGHIGNSYYEDIITKILVQTNKGYKVERFLPVNDSYPEGVLVSGQVILC